MPESSSQSSSQDEPPPLQLKTSSYDAIKERILSTSHSNTAMLTDEGVSDENSDDSSSDDSDSVSLEWAKTVLLQAFAWYYIYDLISGYSSTAYVKSGNIPFMTLALTNLFIWGQAADRDRERQTHEDRLDSVLRSWNFERITVPGDGDCMSFYISSYEHKTSLPAGNRIPMQYTKRSLY